MATRTFAVLRDARVGTDGSLNLGAGACDHLPTGVGGGYEYYSFIKFDNDFSSMTNISDAKLYLTNSDEYHLTRSGSRQFYLDRVTATWSEGTASHPMTTANAVTWNGPSVSATRFYGPYTCDDVNDDQKQYDIMGLIYRWAPSTVYVDGYGYGLGSTNYGLRIIYATGDDVEFWSSEKGGASNVPKIVITYTDNSLPTTEITSPADGSVVDGGTTYATPSVTIDSTSTDSDGDAIANIQYEFDTTADFASPYLTSTANDDTAGVVSRAVSSALHPRGTEIFVRARSSDATGYGDWSSTVSFTINDATAPVITGTATTAMEATVEGADTGPRAVVRFTYSDPEGQSISRYTAGLYSDSGGTALLGTLHDVSTTTPPDYVKSDYTGLVFGTTYYWFVQTWDADGLSTGRVSQARVARWAVREEYVALTTATWSTVTSKTEATDTRAVVQHGIQTAGAAGTNPTNYNTDPAALSSLTPTYYWAKFWLFAWNGAAISGVSVTSHSLSYTSTGLAADGWTLGTGASITTARSWYGTRCVRIDGNGTGRDATATVYGLKVGSTYTLSGRIFASANSGAQIFMYDGATGYGHAKLSDAMTRAGLTSTAATAEFMPVYGTFVAPSETMTVYCWMNGAASTYAMFDATKLEEGPVATPWTPSVLGRAVVVDGNGVQVDGRGGGVVRFRGSDITSTESEVDLIDRGLRFSSPITFKEISAPSSPAAGYRRLYLKSDGLLYLKNSGGTETAVGGNTVDTLAATLAAGADANNVAISNVDLAAGSASAGTWPTLASGTLLTTAEAGAIERDANTFYLTTDDGNRGIVPGRHLIRVDSARTLSNSASQQKIFNDPTNGALTLETGAYLFKGFFALGSMSGTSGNLTFSALGAGTATIGTTLMALIGRDVNASNAASTISGFHTASASLTGPTPSVVAATNLQMWFSVEGTFEVTSGGTIIPSVTLDNAAAATVTVGSYFYVERIGSTSLVSVGQWT